MNMKGVKRGETVKLICISSPDEYEFPLLFTHSIAEVSQFTGLKRKSVSELLSRQRRSHTKVITMGGYHVEQL